MRKTINAMITVVLALVIIFPLFYMVSTSFFSPQDFRAEKALFFPSSFSWENYRAAVGKRYFSDYIINSVMTSILTSGGRTLAVLFAAFSFSHLEFKGKKVLFALLLSTLFIPQDALLYQNYSTISSLGLLDSWAGIVLPSLFSASQLVLLVSAFNSMDRDLYDACRVDGASDMLYIFRVLAPLSASIIITIMLQSAIAAFNSYLWPLLVTNKPKARTIQVALSMLGFREEGKVGAESASAVLVTLPFLILLALGKKKIDEALRKGSLSE